MSSRFWKLLRFKMISMDLCIRSFAGSKPLRVISFVRSSRPVVILSARASRLNQELILDLAFAVRAMDTQSREGPLTSLDEDWISTMSLFLSSYDNGTIRPFTLAPCMWLPMPEWIAYAKSIGHEPLGSLITSCLGVYTKISSGAIFILKDSRNSPESVSSFCESIICLISLIFVSYLSALNSCELPASL